MPLQGDINGVGVKNSDPSPNQEVLDGTWGFMRERLVHPRVEYYVRRSGMASWGYTGTTHTQVTNINVVHPNVPAFNCTRPYSSSAKDSAIKNDIPITSVLEESPAFKASSKDNAPARSVFFFPKPVQFNRGEEGFIELYRNENRYQLDGPLLHIVVQRAWLVDKKLHEGIYIPGQYANPGCEGNFITASVPVLFIFNDKNQLLTIGKATNFNNHRGPSMVNRGSTDIGPLDSIDYQRPTLVDLITKSYAPWTAADPEGKAERDEKDRIEREEREKLLRDNNRAAEEIKEAQRKATLLAVDKLALEEKESKARDEVRAKLKRDQEESDRLRKQEEDSKAANDKLVADALADAEALAADQEAKDRASRSGASSRPKTRTKSKPKDDEELDTPTDASDGPSAMTIGLIAGGGFFTLILLILLLKKASRG
jgi:hypothetical protein